MKRPWLIKIIIMLSLSNIVFAQNLEEYTRPNVTKSVKADYPRDLARLGKEGTVTFSFMVDTEGNIFDPIIISSTGDERFHRAALKALDKLEIESAKLNGKPIISSSVFTYRFGSSFSGNNARKSFVKVYREFRQELGDGSEPNAEALSSILENLIAKETKTHYEYAFVNYAKYLYSAVLGTPEEQMEHLWAALNSREKYAAKTFLPYDTAILARRELFKLEIANNRLNEAMQTYTTIVNSNDSIAAEEFQSAYEQLDDYRTNDLSYGMSATINDDGFWFIDMHKRNFFLTQITGDVEGITLRCNRRYELLAGDADISYGIPESWGACAIQITGNPGTSFSFVQR